MKTLGETLGEALRSTQPGRHADTIDHVLYYHSEKIGPERSRQLREAFHFLEELAYAELHSRVEPWIKELLGREPNKEHKVSAEEPLP